MSRRSARSASYGDSRTSPRPKGRDAPHGVVGLLGDRDRYLFIRRGPAVSAPGWWCLPGGGIEPGESEQDALVRELREELGITVVPLVRLWRAVTAWGADLAWWEARWEPGPGNDHLTLDPEEAAEATWFTADQVLIQDRLLGSNVAFLRELPRLRRGAGGNG